MAEYASLARVEDVPPGAIYEAERDGRSLIVVNVGGDSAALRARGCGTTKLDRSYSDGILWSHRWQNAVRAARDTAFLSRTVVLIRH